MSFKRSVKIISKYCVLLLKTKRTVIKFDSIFLSKVFNNLLEVFSSHFLHCTSIVTKEWYSPVVTIRVYIKETMGLEIPGLNLCQ